MLSRGFVEGTIAKCCSATSSKYRKRCRCGSPEEAERPGKAYRPRSDSGRTMGGDTFPGLSASSGLPCVSVPDSSWPYLRTKKNSPHGVPPEHLASQCGRTKCCGSVRF